MRLNHPPRASHAARPLTTAGLTPVNPFPCGPTAHDARPHGAETVKALHDASSAGNVGKMRLALQAGVDVDSNVVGSGTTAPMIACVGGHEAAARVLLEAGAVVDSKVHGGGTALMV